MKMKTKKIFSDTRAVFNSKSALFPVLFATLIILAISVSYVLATPATNVIVRGDVPNDGATYHIFAYEGASSNPCPGGTSALASATASPGMGDSANDNDDYMLNLTSVSDLYVYYCTATGGSGDLRLTYHKNSVSSDTTYYIDLGKVVGTSLNSDLDSDRAIVCDALNGAELSSERFDWNKVSGGSYTQFYAIDQGTTGSPVAGNAYVLFDTETDSASCTFDATIATGRIIRLNSSSEKYGVYVTFAPDTKATGDAHSDFNADRGEIYGDGINLGINYISNGQCLDTSHDDYTLYYDEPASGTLRYGLYSGTATTQIEELTNLGLAFGTQDFIVRISGTIPAGITKVEATDSNGVTYTDTPSGGNYDLYIADANTIASLITVNFYKGASIVFTKSVAVTSQDNSCAQDIQLGLAKYYGTAHDDLKTGYSIGVYSDDAFTAKISDSSYPGDPDDSTGDYEVYFDATGSPQTYLLIDGATYDTKVFGDQASVGDEIEFNPDAMLSGTVHAEIDLVQTAGWNAFRDRKSTRLNSSHTDISRMPSSA